MSVSLPATDWRPVQSVLRISCYDNWDRLQCSCNPELDKMDGHYYSQMVVVMCLEAVWPSPLYTEHVWYCVITSHCKKKRNCCKPSKGPVWGKK